MDRFPDRSTPSSDAPARQRPTCRFPAAFPIRRASPPIRARALAPWTSASPKLRPVLVLRQLKRQPSPQGCVCEASWTNHRVPVRPVPLVRRPPSVPSMKDRARSSRVSPPEVLLSWLLLRIDRGANAMADLAALILVLRPVLRLLLVLSYLAQPASQQLLRIAEPTRAFGFRGCARGVAR